VSDGGRWVYIRTACCDFRRCHFSATVYINVPGACGLSMDITARAQSLVDKFDRVLGAFLLDGGGYVRLGVRNTEGEGGKRGKSDEVDLILVHEFVQLCKDKKRNRLINLKINTIKNIFTKHNSELTFINLLETGIQDPESINVNSYILDIAHYLDSVMHEVLMKVIGRFDKRYQIVNGEGTFIQNYLDRSSELKRSFDRMLERVDAKVKTMRVYKGEKKWIDYQVIIGDNMAMKTLDGVIKYANNSKLKEKLIELIVKATDSLAQELDLDYYTLAGQREKFTHQQWLKDKCGGGFLKGLKILTLDNMVAILEVFPYQNVQEIFVLGLAVICREIGSGEFRDICNNLIHFASPVPKNDKPVLAETGEMKLRKNHTKKTETTPPRKGQFDDSYRVMNVNLQSVIRSIIRNGSYPINGIREANFTEQMKKLLNTEKIDPIPIVKEIYSVSPNLCEALFYGGMATLIRNMVEKNKYFPDLPASSSVFGYDIFLQQKLDSILINGVNIEQAYNFTSEVIHSLNIQTDLWSVAAPIVRVELLRYVFNIFLREYVSGEVLEKFSDGTKRLTIGEIDAINARKRATKSRNNEAKNSVPENPALPLTRT